MSDRDRPSVLLISLDARLADLAGERRAAAGDALERHRRYAAGLGALHVVVKSGRDVPAGPSALATNAWSYPTRSRSRLGFVPRAIQLADRICRKRPVNVVSTQDPFATGLAGAIVARRHRRPLNIQLHFDVLDNPHWLAERPEHRLLNVLGKWLIARADTVRVGTRRERAKLLSWGISPHRVWVAPVPVDVGRFAGSALAARAAREARGVPPTVLAACRLVPQKDVPALIDAAATVCRQRPDVRFVVAGDGPLRHSVARLTAERGLAGRFHLLGAVDRRTMPALYAGADVFAVSSTYEGTSLVTVEAAASALPVVTTDVAGAADTVVDGQTGLVVPPRDPEALAHAVLALLANRPRAREMGAAGQQHVWRAFDPAVATARVLDLWRATGSLPRRDPH